MTTILDSLAMVCSSVPDFMDQVFRENKPKRLVFTHWLPLPTRWPRCAPLASSPALSTLPHLVHNDLGCTCSNPNIINDLRPPPLHPPPPLPPQLPWNHYWFNLHSCNHHSCNITPATITPATSTLATLFLQPSPASLQPSFLLFDQISSWMKSHGDLFPSDIFVDTLCFLLLVFVHQPDNYMIISPTSCDVFNSACSCPYLILYE